MGKTVLIWMTSLILAVGLTAGQNDDTGFVGKFHCDRPGQDCLNIDRGVTCSAGTGTCVCSEGLEGYDCSINSTYVTPMEYCEGGCGEGGVCYADPDEVVIDGDSDDPDLTVGVCRCSAEYYGENCKTRRFFHICKADSIEVRMVPLGDFFGRMYAVGYEDDPQCELDVAGDGYGKEFQFEDCGGVENETLDNGDQVVALSVKVQHSFFFMDTDETYRFVCTIKSSGSDVEFEGEGLDHEKEDENSHKDVEEEFVPVTQEIVTENGRKVEGRQKLGSPLVLRFTLDGGDVYKSFRADEIEAWNGKEGPEEVTFPIVHDGCVTEQANRNKVVLDFTRRNDGTVELKYKLFRLPGSYQLRFKNVVKVCKTPADCEPEACDGPFQGYGRKRRSLHVDLDTTLFERINETVFIAHPDEQGHTKYNSYYIAKEALSTNSQDDSRSHRDVMLDCMSNVGFLIVCIVLAILLLLALAILAVFCVRIYHSTGRSRDRDGNGGGSGNKGYDD